MGNQGETTESAQRSGKPHRRDSPGPRHMNRSLRGQLLCGPNGTVSFTINSSSFLRVGLPTVSQPQVCPQFFILLQLDFFPLSAHLFSLLSIISVLMMMMMMPPLPLLLLLLYQTRPQVLSPCIGHFYLQDAPSLRTQQSQN